jgi:hypothetical protein
MRAAVNVHNHHDGRGHHKDIRLFVPDERGRPTVVHFSSAGGLPGPGRMGRWRALDAPHLSDGAHRVNKSLQGVRGHERFAFESHDDADLHEHDGKSGITYLSVGGSRYAISGGTGGVHFVKNLDSVEKVALLKQSEDFSLGQVWLVDRARQMGLIPPDNTAQNPQSAQQALVGGIQGALGTGLKTLSLSFLGGLGAGAGWGLGRRLTDRVPNNEKSAANEDPADSPDALGESPADYRPEDPIAFKPADPAATVARSMVESRFGLAKGDPL